MISVSVEHIMAPEVVAINSNKSVRFAAGLMERLNISSLIVLHKDEISGIVTERDMMTRVICCSQNPKSTKVLDIMSSPVIVVSPSTSLEEAVGIMLRNNIKKLPVVSAKGLVGMLSLTDVARIQPHLIQTLNEVLQIEAQQAPQEADFYIR